MKFLQRPSVRQKRFFIYSSSYTGSSVVVVLRLPFLRMGTGFLVVAGLGFSSSSSWASVKRSLYQSSLPREKEFLSNPLRCITSHSHSPSLDLPGPLAAHSDGIKGLTQLAAVPPGSISINTDVEHLAVVGIRVAWVRDRNGLVDHRALEVEHVTGHAALLGVLVRPRADAGLGAEDEAIGTGDHVEFALDAVEELVAGSLLGRGKVAVLPRAVGTGLRGLCKSRGSCR